MNLIIGHILEQSMASGPTWLPYHRCCLLCLSKPGFLSLGPLKVAMVALEKKFHNGRK